MAFELPQMKISPFAFTSLSSVLLNKGQARCQRREHSPHASLLVSNLQPEPRPVPPLADLVSNPTPPGHISRERMRFDWRAILAATLAGLV